MSVDKKKKILIYFDYIYKKKLIFFISYFLLLLFFFFILGKINNKIQWQDEYEYIQRGLGISFIDFNFATLSDGFRPPLFPIIIKFLSLFSRDSLLIIIKIFNIFLISILPFILMYISKKINDKTYSKILFIGSFINFIFIPNLYFVQFAYAELISIFFFNIYLYLSIFIFFSKKNLLLSFVLAFILAILFYLKANYILLAFLFLIFFKDFKKNFKFNSFFFIFLFFMIFPWLFYMHKITNEYKFTNSQYLNRLLGMGYDIIVENKNHDTIHGKFLLKIYKDDDKQIGIYHGLSNKLKISNFEKHNQININFQLFREKISKETINELSKYNSTERVYFSALKNLHLFGGSFRGVKDYVIFSFSILCLISILFCLKYISLRLIFYINAINLLILLVQTFYYVPTIRYAVIFYNSIILCFSSVIFFLFIKKNLNDTK
jgi:hypothetical protein